MRSYNKQKYRRSAFFDECAVCEIVKKAEEQNQNLSLKEFRKAFAKQHQKNSSKDI